MDNTIGLAPALVAMEPDETGHRYDGSLMLSALPQAPTITGQTRWERLVAFAAKRRTRTARHADGRIHGGSQAIARLESA
jgi:hypothetical protein